jgi:tRNA A-37 threonylcarbamoyl transferase component Bud32
VSLPSHPNENGPSSAPGNPRSADTAFFGVEVSLSPCDSWVPPPPDEPLLTKEPRKPKQAGSSSMERSDDPLSDELGLSDKAGSAESGPHGAAPELPGFVVLGECGRGGMGVVYLAVQVGLKRRVALKLLKPELAASAIQRGRFRTESTTLARLQHPNIVQVFDSGTHQDRAYIVQEYLAGGSLDRKLSRQPQAARPAVELIATLALAVEHAHAQKIVHRDLKPANVLLTTDGIPKISDFGLAKQVDVQSESGQTQSGSILGSPSYMAPEQALGRRGDIGPAVDIYALGAILYEMVTGRPPFLAASVMETLLQVRQSEPVPPRQLQPGLPRDVETICLKCLAKDPARRYPTAGALADDLKRFLENRPIMARPASAPERLAKWVRRRPATAASLAVALLAALALVAGRIVYEGRLRDTLEQSRASAELAREQKQNADARYRLARQALNKMLARLDDRTLVQTPRVKELKRGQLEDSLSFYREVVKDRQAADPAVRLDVAEGEPSEAFQSCQALDLARLGEHRKAWEMVRSLEPSLRSVSQHHSYAHRLIAACSACIGSAEKDQSLSSAERAALGVQYGDKGADLLRRVLELASAAERPARRKELRENKDMASLLRRKDVDSLLADATTSRDDVRPGAASEPRGSKCGDRAPQVLQTASHDRQKVPTGPPRRVTGRRTVPGPDGELDAPPKRRTFPCRHPGAVQPVRPQSSPAGRP